MLPLIKVNHSNTRSPLTPVWPLVVVKRDNSRLFTLFFLDFLNSVYYVWYLWPSISCVFLFFVIFFSCCVNYTFIPLLAHTANFHTEAPFTDSWLRLNECFRLHYAQQQQQQTLKVYHANSVVLIYFTLVLFPVKVKFSGWKKKKNHHI